MALTDSKIKGLKPKPRRYLASDGRGLSLDVLPSGRMSWLYRYHLNGKQERVKLGLYPDVSLSDARKQRDKLASKVANGESPAGEKKQAQSLAREGLSENPTVREFGECYYKEQVIPNWKDPITIHRYLTKEVYPTLGSRALKDVNALDVQALVYRKRDGGHVLDQ